MNLIRILFAALACVFSLSVAAQWQWVDKDGHKVFSDRAPPADIPEKNILKRPAGRGTVSDAAPAPQAGASAPRLSGVDKDLLEKKKQATEADAAKRKAEEEKIAKAKAENCERGKRAKANLDSGMRISRTNAKGEREFLDDASRLAESQRIQSIIDTDCQ